MDKGYDGEPVHHACTSETSPSGPLKENDRVKRGDHKPPCCEHGEWRFAGADCKRKATKWRCPTGECKPASVWIKADRLHPLIPRETLRWKALSGPGVGRACVRRCSRTNRVRAATGARDRARRATCGPHILAQLDPAR